jgi:hypothetical protein
LSRPGSNLGGLLGELHAQGCDGNEYSACRPVVVPAGAGEEPTYLGRDRGAQIVVVFLAWCCDCGAADWEAV